MLKIKKGDCPKCLLKYKGKKYSDITFEDKIEIKESLNNEQNGLCAYCCKKISVNDGNIEHIAPQSRYKKKSIEYSNMLLSCNNINTCNAHKENKYNEELFISPLDEDCEEMFGFNIMTGEIEVSLKYEEEKNICEKVKWTIDVLNLNDKSLINARANIIKGIRNIPKEDLMNCCNKEMGYYDVVKFFLNNE